MSCDIQPNPKQKKKKWTEMAENVLIDLWGDKIEELRGLRKNTHIYEEMGEELKIHCFDFSPQEIKTKLENFRRKYV